MALPGWIYGIALYAGGILTGIYGPVGKYAFEKANDLKELIVKTRGLVSDIKNPPANPEKTFAQMASDLRTKLELTRFYDLIRYLLLVPLPPHTNVLKAVEFLPGMTGITQ